MIDALEAFENWFGEHVYRPVMCRLFGHQPREDGWFVRCWRCRRNLT